MPTIVLICDDDDIESCLRSVISQPRYIAITAEGAYALEKRNLPVVRPRDFFDQAAFTRLAHNIFDQISDSLHQYEREGTDSQEILSFNLYYIFYEFIGTLSRAAILGSAIAKIRPDKVLISSPNQKDSQLRDFYAKVCAAMDVPLVFLLKTRKVVHYRSRSLWIRGLLRNIQIVWSRNKTWRKSTLPHLLVSQAKGSLLYVGGASYDWGVFRDYARNALPNFLHFSLERTSGCAPWEIAVAYLQRDGYPRFKISLGPPESSISRLAPVDFKNSFTVPVGGVEIDFGDALGKIINKVTAQSRTILEHSRGVARRVAEEVSPSAVCFSEMSSMCSRALCQEFNRLDIPTIFYQNGGVYGTQENPAVEEMAQAYARYFFSYGPAIQPRKTDKYGAVTEFVATGSLRLHDLKALNAWWREKSGSNKKINVLWISEGTTRNTFGLWYQLEDVSRFELQRRGLGILARAQSAKIIYRPIPSQIATLITPDWLKKSFPRITIDDYSESRYLIASADIVICDVHSNSSWDEALACGKPMIVFVDEQVTLLRPEYVEAASKSCRWCSTPEAFLEELRSLSQCPQDYLRTYDRDPISYLARYAQPGTESLATLQDILTAPKTDCNPS